VLIFPKWLRTFESQLPASFDGSGLLHIFSQSSASTILIGLHCNNPLLTHIPTHRTISSTAAKQGSHAENQNTFTHFSTPLY
jgi:hypothetical protein